MDERERRIGQNEILFRSINEKIESLNEAFGTLTESITVVCECGNVSCAEQIEVSTGDYERVRSDPTHFIVVPGHEEPDVEDVVERQERFDVVRKHEDGPAQLARDLDPRA